MTRRIGLAGMLAGCVALGAAAIPARANAPIPPPPELFPPTDSVQLPPDRNVLWHDASIGVATGREVVQEKLPAGETPQAWTQIITIKTMPRDRDPQAVAAGTVNLLRDVCGHVNIVTTPHRQLVGEVRSLNLPLPEFDATDLLVTCKDPDMAKLHAHPGTERVTLRRYEVTWYKLMKGRYANYIVQRAWHGDDIDGSSPLGSAAVLAAWKSWMTGVTLVRSRSAQ